MNLTSAVETTVFFLCLAALTNHALPMDESRDENRQEFARRGDSPVVYFDNIISFVFVSHVFNSGLHVVTGFRVTYCFISK